MTDTAIARFGDVLIGVWRDRVVSAYDITGHKRVDNGMRVVFDVEDSKEFGYLVGQPSPVGAWKQGQARPIVYEDTEKIRSGDAPQTSVGDATRAVVGGFVLTVSGDGHATVIPPQGGTVLVAAPLRRQEHPFTYTDDEGTAYPAAIIDKHPMGGWIFIEYIRDGQPVIESVEDSRVEDLRD
ncbi:hypothetical protein [uncultured Microbacterium sp.]|uniref:hypothetical protein n=1 Tax=uncultured Microbacterium sp. TaxID=191216 RepID=UPI002637C8DE|nr:hypothetical protein [uncultured Microbacterium sp.]